MSKTLSSSRLDKKCDGIFILQKMQSHTKLYLIKKIIQIILRGLQLILLHQMYI